MDSSGAIQATSHVHVANADTADELDNVRYEHHLKHRGRADKRIFSMFSLIVTTFLLVRLAQKLYRWWSRRCHRTHRYRRIQPYAHEGCLDRVKSVCNAIALLPTPRIFGFRVTTFSLGRFILLTIYLAIISSLHISVDAHVLSQHYLDDVAFRAAWVTLTQIPLVYLLSTKRGPINLIAGLSYERINWIHRWIGRILFLSATTHVVIMKSFISMKDIMRSHDQGMTVMRYGIATYAILIWIAVTSILPLRRWSYRVFYINHYISTFTFLFIAFQHVPKHARMPIYLAASIVAIDKLLVASYFIRHHCSLLPPLRRFAKFRRGPGRGRLVAGFPVRMSAPSMSIQSIPSQTAETTTIIRITSIPFVWKPGQHIRLYIPALGRWEIHPFTPANCSAIPAPPIPPRKDVETGTAPFGQPPQTSDMLLMIKSKSGLTRRFAEYHKSWLARPCPNATRTDNETLTAYIDGPYGYAPTWKRYENLVLIASSTGVSFILSILDHLEQLCFAGSSEELETRNVKFVWMMRHLDPAFEEVVRAMVGRCSATLRDCGVSIDPEFYVTCLESEVREEMVHFDAFAHLRWQAQRSLVTRPPLRIRHPDEIYDEWDREAEMEASGWKEEGPFVTQMDSYDEESDESDELSTLVDGEGSRKSEDDDRWMEEDEENPFSNAHAYPTDQRDDAYRPLPPPRSQSRGTSSLDSPVTSRCQCALIQHQRQKLHSHRSSSDIVTSQYGTRPDVLGILECARGPERRSMVAVCSNENVVREIRGTVGQINMECTRGRRDGSVELFIEGGQ